MEQHIRTRPSYAEFVKVRKEEHKAGYEERPHIYVSQASQGLTYTNKVKAVADLSATRNELVQNLQTQRKREVELIRSQMIKQLKKSVDVEKMPSVRVRPTLRVELKHRVLNCKMAENKKMEPINIDNLNQKVL